MNSIIFVCKYLIWNEVIEFCPFLKENFIWAIRKTLKKWPIHTYATTDFDMSRLIKNYHLLQLTRHCHEHITTGCLNLKCSIIKISVDPSWCIMDLQFLTSQNHFCKIDVSILTNIYLHCNSNFRLVWSPNFTLRKQARFRTSMSFVYFLSLVSFGDCLGNSFGRIAKTLPLLFYIFPF